MLLKSPDFSSVSEQPTCSLQDTDDVENIAPESSFDKPPFDEPPLTYDSIYLEMDNLRKEKNILLKENEELKSLLGQNGMRYAAAIEKEETCILLTGLKPKVLVCLVNYLIKGQTQKTNHKIPFEDQIVLTIIKLKPNLIFDLLALTFRIAPTTAIDYFWCWIDIMHLKLKRLVRMQDRDHIFRTIPPHF